jgi:hypothetical protein
MIGENTRLSARSARRERPCFPRYSYPLDPSLYRLSASGWIVIDGMPLIDAGETRRGLR